MKTYKIPQSKAVITRVVIEILALLILVYPMMHIYVFLQGSMEPNNRGFFCNDDSLKHPDVKEEISVGECFIVWACIVIVVVPCVELLHVTIFSHGYEVRLGKIPWVVVELYRILGYFTMGAFFTLLTTELAKYKIGRKRPYFLTICNLTLTEDLCMKDGHYIYVEDYKCRASAHDVREASKSFLSGHSSFSFYSATFLIFYLHARLSNFTNTNMKSEYPKIRNIFRGLKIIRPFFQFGIFSLAFYICLTRITDFKHHPGDVITGIFVGIFFAIIILIFIMDLFNKPRTFKMVDAPSQGINFDELDGKNANEMKLRSRKNSEAENILRIEDSTQTSVK